MFHPAPDRSNAFATHLYTRWSVYAHSFNERLRPPPNTLCLNRSTGRNLTSELEALTLSPQREPLGLISPHTSYFPCKARSSCVTARLVEGSLYTSASDRMVGTTTVNLARGGRSQLKTSEPSAGRGIHLSLWMVRPIECPRRLW